MQWATLITTILGLALNAIVIAYSYGRLTERVTAQGTDFVRRTEAIKDSVPQLIRAAISEHELNELKDAVMENKKRMRDDQ
jgi:hypothetical protein